MMRPWGWALGIWASSWTLAACAQETLDLAQTLAKPILAANAAQADVQALVKSRIPPIPAAQSIAEWEQYAARVRSATLENVVFRGAAARDWRDAPLHVEWLETLDGGPGYRVKKLRYEALPGLWIPAILYEPLQRAGQTPVFLNVNGHDRDGKAAVYKQIRCINQAKRGVLSLNVEWLGMGQLANGGYAHSRMNQLDLCGASGLSVFYLAMSRGLDVLLSLEGADPARVGVAGLSGGGWQTIILSALDTRVTLSNPVAGYSSFLTRVDHHSDLGDSEQTPTDLGLFGDYLQLTALCAPRPTLLTYNIKDNCCFASDHALPPLLAAAEPIYQLYGRPEALRSHVNVDPGTHNFEKDNRLAHYRMLGAHFFPGDANFPVDELPTEGEVRTKEELNVPLPTVNEDFHSLAQALAQELPRVAALPEQLPAAQGWQQELRARLARTLSAELAEVQAEAAGVETTAGTRIVAWKLRTADGWNVPVLELSRGTPQGTTVVCAEAGRAAAAAQVEALLAAGQRVLATDVFYWGECAINPRSYLWALLVATVGERPLGVQAGQLAAVSRWAQREFGQPVTLRGIGPRASVAALAAAALLPADALSAVAVEQPLGSFKQVIEENRSFDQSPELFCFGLLETCDVRQLVALAAPRKVRVTGASDRVKQELAGLERWFVLWPGAALTLE